MLTIYPFDQLGKADYGWLKANYHFSFGEYHNPDKMGFGPLCVWNDDEIQAGKGFPRHPHKNMEIITYVREGAITHKDSMGNEGRTEACSIQIMSAGSGVTHSEYNLEETETRLFQIWLRPHTEDLDPRWETAVLDRNMEAGFHCLASGVHGDNAKIEIYQQARLWRALGNEGTSLSFPDNRIGSMYAVVSKGQIQLDDKILNSRDAFFITEDDESLIQSIESSEIILVEIDSSTTI